MKIINFTIPYVCTFLLCAAIFGLMREKNSFLISIVASGSTMILLFLVDYLSNRKGK